MQKNRSARFVIGLWLAAAVLSATPLTVRIVDSQGEAVPRALVAVGDRPPAATGSEGILRVDAEPPITVRVTAPGFTIETRRLDSWDGEIVVTLRPEPVYSTVDVIVRQEDLSVGPVETNAIQIDRVGARTVFDAVDKLVPSAFVTKRGVMGYGIAGSGTGMVSIRGVGNSPNTGVLMVVDGRPDYMGLMGHPLPDFYSLTDAESVSVTLGPASVLYGSHAMGGAVNVRPSEPVEGFRTELSGSLGSYWTGQHRLKHGAGFRKWFYNMTAGADHTNGHRESSHFRNQDGTAAVGYELSRNWKTSLRGRYGHFVVEDPGTLAAARPGDWASVGRGGFSWNLDNSTSRVWGSSRVFSSWGHHHISDGWRSNDRTTGARVHQNFLVAPALLVDAGMDVVNFGGVGRNVRSRRDYGDHDVSTGAGFGRLHWTPLPRLRLNTGLRFEHNTVFGGIAAPEFGASYTLADGYSLHFAAARGFRNPTIRELYLFPAPNPDLQPEHLWNYQATVELRPVRGVAASVTGYYADLDNMIVVTGGWPNIKLLNAGQALNRGVDSTVRVRVSRRLALHGGYAYLRSTNLAPYLPRHKGTYAAEANLGRAFLYFGGVAVSKRWANPQKTAELDGYTLPSVKLMLPLGRRWTVFGMVDNLFDSDYQVITGYPMPGINATGGFTLRF